MFTDIILHIVKIDYRIGKDRISSEVIVDVEFISELFAYQLNDIEVGILEGFKEKTVGDICLFR